MKTETDTRNGWMYFADWLLARGLTAYQVAKDLELAESTVGKWRKGGIPAYRMRLRLQEHYTVISSINPQGRWIVKDGGLPR